MPTGKNLLTGNIFHALIRLSLPIMGSSFLHMTYHLVDMIWIGFLGSDALAAVGVAGYFMMFSMALIRLVQVGTEVNIAQALGGKQEERARSFAVNALRLAVFIAFLYGLMLILFNRSFIGFFNIQNAWVEAEAGNYLFLMALGMIFFFLNPVITCIYNGSGSSKAPFQVNAIGMAANMLLDPLFIFGLNLGIRGAAIATLLSQILVTVILIRLLLTNRPFPDFRFQSKLKIVFVTEILQLGAPVALQTGLFSVFSILLARIVAGYGPEAIAAQKIGVQIESISYMTANGFAVALSAFTGQNNGASQPERIRRGIVTAGIIMVFFGLLTSAALYIFARPLFMVFIREPDTVAIGTRYLQILALSQLFMCLEISLAGGFNGLGKTLVPAMIGVLFTGLRVPAALWLAQESRLGLEGVWWTMTGTSWIKGLLMVSMIMLLLRQLKAEPSHPQSLKSFCSHTRN